jgi:hypothetical protein
MSRLSLRAKLIAAFLLALAAVATLGAVAFDATRTLGSLTMQMFDGPLQTINFTRLAQTDFAVLQRREHELFDADDPAAQAEIARLTEDFRKDLAIAGQRSASPEVPGLVEGLQKDLETWENKIRAARVQAGAGVVSAGTETAARMRR